jgi:hypothetical protein
MKYFQAALLSALALSQAVLAEFSYAIEATHNGVPIPQDQIKLEAHEPTTDILNRTWAPSPPSSKPPSRTGKRSNPVSISANWCGAVKHTNSSNQIKIVHGYFQHPTCSLRSGVTSYPQYAAPWVGIDGDTWTSAILQSGTVCTVCSFRSQASTARASLIALALQCRSAQPAPCRTRHGFSGFRLLQLPYHQCQAS